MSVVRPRTFAARWTLLIAALGLAAISTVLFFLGSHSAPPRIDRLRIGYAVEAPYAFIAPNGEVTGESPEIARRIAGELGIAHIDWVQTTFGSLIADLRANRFDVIAAGMFISQARATQVAFSQPSFHAKEALLVRRGNPHRLHAYVDAVTRTDVKIAVLAGSIEEQVLTRLGLPRTRLRMMPDALTGRVAVANGLVDGLALSSPSVRWMAAQDESRETEAAESFQQSADEGAALRGYGAYAFRQQDRDLLIAWDTAMARFIGTDEHLRLVAHFGFAREDIEHLPALNGILSK